MTLTSAQRKLVLTIHIATTVGVLGADAVLLALGISGVRGVDPVAVYPPMQLIAEWVVAPLIVPIVVTGAVLALFTGYSPLRYPWVAAKIGVTLLLIIALTAFVIPGLTDAAHVALTPSEPPLTSAEQTSFVIAPALATSLLLLNVALGVYKPIRRRADGDRRRYKAMDTVGT